MTSNFPILEDSVTEIRAQVAEGNEDSDKKKGGGLSIRTSSYVINNFELYRKIINIFRIDECK